MAFDVEEDRPEALPAPERPVADPEHARRRRRELWGAPYARQDRPGPAREPERDGERPGPTA